MIKSEGEKDVMKAALFDLDGTLLNRDASIELFIEQQYERLKSVFGSISKEQYRTRFIQLDKRGYVEGLRLPAISRRISFCSYYVGRTSSRLSQRI